MCCQGKVDLDAVYRSGVFKFGAVTGAVFLELLRISRVAKRYKITPTREYLQDSLKLSPKQVRTALKTLVKHGFIHRQWATKRATTTILNYESFLLNGASPRANDVGVDVRRSPGVDVSSVSGVSSPVVLNSKEAAQKAAPQSSPPAKPKKKQNRELGWFELVDFIKASYQAKKDAPMLMTHGHLTQLTELTNIHRASGVAGLWKVYLEGREPKAVEDGFAFKRFCWLIDRLVDDRRWKKYQSEFEAKWFGADRIVNSVGSMVEQGMKDLGFGAPVKTPEPIKVIAPKAKKADDDRYTLTPDWEPGEVNLTAMFKANLEKLRKDKIEALRPEPATA